MIYEDLVYWRMKIDEPVVIEIMASKEMQRLKWVDWAWYFEPFFHWTAHSRFEHSVWVYLLLKKYWAPIEEQIAWLIHDLSHGTFSHCLDYVFEEWNPKEQSHQDNTFDEFVRSSSLPLILDKYWWSLEHILDDSRHPLKENNLPDICADRIDYCLRDAVHYKNISIEEINSILNNLIAIDNAWVFSTFEIAKKYTKIFSDMNDIWSGIEAAVMFSTVWDFLKYAWNKWYVKRDDFYTTDKEVLGRINKYLHTDGKLNLLRDRMNNKIPFENNPNDYDNNVFCKSRIVDPLFMKEWEIFRISDMDKDFWSIVTNKSKVKEYFIKFKK